VSEPHDVALLHCCFDVVFGFCSDDLQSQILPEARTILHKLRGTTLEHIREMVAKLPEYPDSASTFEHSSEGEASSTRLPHTRLNGQPVIEFQHSLAAKIAKVFIDSEQNHLVPASGQRSRRLQPLMSAVQFCRSSAGSPPLSQEQLDVLAKFRSDLQELSMDTNTLPCAQPTESVNLPLLDFVRSEMNVLQRSSCQIVQDLSHILAVRRPYVLCMDIEVVHRLMIVVTGTAHAI